MILLRLSNKLDECILNDARKILNSHCCYHAKKSSNDNYSNNRSFDEPNSENRTSTRNKSYNRSKYPTLMKMQKSEWLKKKNDFLDKKIDQIKRQNEIKDKKEELKEFKQRYNITEDNQYEILNQELIPLHLVDYETQVKIKTRRLELFLEQFVKKIKDYSSTIILDKEGHPCVFHDLIRTEFINEYQSQNEFQIGIDVSKQIAVGFMFGSFKDDNRICIRPIKFAACKKSHRLLAEKFEDYLINQSTLRVNLDYKSTMGNWNTFFVRSNQDGEHQCIAKLTNKENLSEEKLDLERKQLVKYFKSISDEFKIKSFYLETHHFNLEDSTGQSELELLFGDHNLPVKYKNNIYNVTPKSLFPLNVEVYGKMIGSLTDNLDFTKSQNLIITCPYSGIGLPDLAKSIRKLIVLNRTEQQITDCKKSLEGISSTNNISFIVGNLTKGLFKILDENHLEIGIMIRQEDLTFQMLNELRNNRNVSKVILISTKPQENLMKIWTHLCLTNINIAGPPFSFISSTPIDTHPHSNIYTILSVFERIYS